MPPTTFLPPSLLHLNSPSNYCDLDWIFDFLISLDVRQFHNTLQQKGLFNRRKERMAERKKSKDVHFTRIKTAIKLAFLCVFESQERRRKKQLKNEVSIYIFTDEKNNINKYKFLCLDFLRSAFPSMWWIYIALCNQWLTYHRCGALLFIGIRIYSSLSSRVPVCSANCSSVIVNIFTVIRYVFFWCVWSSVENAKNAKQSKNVKL